MLGRCKFLFLPTRWSFGGMACCSINWLYCLRVSPFYLECCPYSIQMCCEGEIRKEHIFKKVLGNTVECDREKEKIKSTSKKISI